MLRSYANPQLTFSKNNGILLRNEFKFIVRTAIKNIDHTRVLCIWFYKREDILNTGCDAQPVLACFQSRKQYTTLDIATGKYKTGTIDGVASRLASSASCYERFTACYSAADDNRIVNFTGIREKEVTSYPDNDYRQPKVTHMQPVAGLESLWLFQNAILQNKRMAERQKKEEIIKRQMAAISDAIPRGMENWARRNYFPKYFLVEKATKKKACEGKCSACGHVFSLAVTHNQEHIICPKCKSDLTAKSFSRVKLFSDRITTQTAQRTKNQGDVVIRTIKIFRYISKHCDNISFWESSRTIYSADGKKTSYYNDQGKWHKGIRPCFYSYYCEPPFASINYGWQFIPKAGLEHTLAGTRWEHCPLEALNNYIQDTFNAEYVFEKYLTCPKIETLIKVGFTKLVMELVFSRFEEIDDKNRVHQILRVQAEDVAFLRDLDIGISELKEFREYGAEKDRKELLLWTQKHKTPSNYGSVSTKHVTDIVAILKYESAHELMKYVEEQNEKGTENGLKSRMFDTLSTYRDYLDMCRKMDLPLDKSVLYPKDLRAAHDRAIVELKAIHNHETAEKFTTACAQLQKIPALNNDEMSIVYPSTMLDLREEGSALHNCVYSYIDRVADGECLIVFVRRKEAMDKSYFCLEWNLKMNKIVQLRGLKNCMPPADVSEFAAEWAMTASRVLSESAR